MRGKIVRPALLALVAAGALGCGMLASVVKYERGGTFDMPDLRGLSVTEAKDKLATSGITGSVSIVDNYVCHEDEQRVPVDHVCSTSPSVGSGRSARTPTTLYTRPRPTAAPMPDVVGMSVAEARRVLAAAGSERVEVEVMEVARIPEGCKPETVCKTSPQAGAPASFGLTKYLSVPPPGWRPETTGRRTAEPDELEGSRPGKPGDATETKPAETKPAETKPAEPIF